MKFECTFYVCVCVGLHCMRECNNLHNGFNEQWPETMGEIRRKKITTFVESTLSDCRREHRISNEIKIVTHFWLPTLYYPRGRIVKSLLSMLFTFLPVKLTHFRVVISYRYAAPQSDSIQIQSYFIESNVSYVYSQM